MTGTPGLSGHLAAPEHGWRQEADVVVVGSGIAGLSVALRMRTAGYRVLIVTKGRVDQGSTGWAQGGIAAALADDDSPAQHFDDTMAAGAGLCDEDAVRVLADMGAEAVTGLVDLGTIFDRTAAGDLALTREGGHLRDRIAHAGGDATGREIVRALVAAVIADPGITLYESALALDLLKDATGAVQGLTLHVMGQGERDGVGAAIAPAVVLATGGFGQVYASTTNPQVATGDGIGMALRAGAALTDMEFIQFHPTVLWLGADAVGQQPLISEAVRGEGAVLLDHRHQRFMVDQHPLAELAPRDVVAIGALRSMLESGNEHVWLDGRGLGEQTWQSRFPTILTRCREAGIDPVRDLIPVSPAQHYASGGVRTDLSGRAGLRGLYACGEVASTGVHGANRLASNSLLEGLVFAERISAALADGLPPRRPIVPMAEPPIAVSDQARPRIQRAMSRGAGVLRSAESLANVAQELVDVQKNHPGVPGTADWEVTNLLAVASVVTHHARLRTESRGSHWRADFEDRDDVNWRVHLQTTLRDGQLHTEQAPRHAPVWPD